jgi:hypothetical protein
MQRLYVRQNIQRKNEFYVSRVETQCIASLHQSQKCVKNEFYMSYVETLHATSLHLAQRIGNEPFQPVIRIRTDTRPPSAGVCERDSSGTTEGHGVKRNARR